MAFLNYREGGIIYIGVDDAGKPVGVQDIDGDMLAIWVSDKLNHNQEQKLCKIFAEDQDVRNSIFKAIKKIENINPREISENLIPDDTEKRDLVLQILRICYMK